MKTKQLLLTFALLLTAGVAQAQSTYTWNAGDWSAYNGNGTVTNNDGVLTCTFGQWCGSVYSTTSFKLPKRQTFIVIKGTNLYCDPTDPNVCNLNGDLGGGKLSGFTANGDNTMIYKDITDILPSETDFFGNVTINSIALYLKKGEGNTTINSIEFYEPDFLDVATTTAITQSSSSMVITTNVSGDFKKRISFTPTAAANTEYKLEITGDQYINPSNAFLVVDMTNNSGSGNRKFAGITVNGSNKYGFTSSNGACSIIDLTIDEVAHKLLIFSPAANSADLLDKYVSNEGLSATKIQMYLNHATADTELTIYRVGFYNLQEIFTLYPSLSAMKWQHVANNTLRMEKTDNTGSIVIKNADSKVPSINHGLAMFRVIGNLTGKNEIDFRNMIFDDEVTPSFLTEDFISQYSNGSIKILFQYERGAYKYFPTMVKKVQLAASDYFQYKDGFSPSGTTYKYTHGTPSASYYSYTRYIKGGYSSMILPFAIDKDALITLGLTPYTFSSATSEGNITFAKVATDKIAANTPLIVNSGNTGYYLIPANASAEKDTSLNPENYYATAASNNVCFVGSFVNKVPDGEYASGENSVNYGITADATSLAKMKSTTKTTFYRAFISDKRTGASTKALSLSFDEGDGTTKIVAPEEIDGLEMTSGNVYNLQGVRMNSDKLPRGIYVRNGKKFVVK